MNAWAKYKYTTNTNVTVEEKENGFHITQCALCSAVLRAAPGVSECYVLWVFLRRAQIQLTGYLQLQSQLRD